MPFDYNNNCNFEDDFDDYLNSTGERNAENTDVYDYNCAGYALNTFSWYYPYDCDTEEINEELWELYEKGLSIKEIYKIKISEFVSKMLHDFNNLRQLPTRSDLKQNERLISFRIFIKFEDDYVDWDFHYRFLDKDGHWKEKSGSLETKKCNESNWHCGSNYYDSNTVYLALEV